MLKFIVMFRAAQPDFDVALNEFITHIGRIPDLLRQQVVVPLGSPIQTMPYARIVELYFASQIAMTESLRSEAGQAAGQCLNRFAPGSFDIVYAEVYEERR